MKIYCALFALCAWNQANGFVRGPTIVGARTGSQLNAATATNYATNVASTTVRDVPSSPSLVVPQTRVGRRETTEEIWQTLIPAVVQGDSLRTCSFDETIDRVQLVLKTTGRPLNANVELWQGPDNTPTKMAIYVEDGSLRAFRATIETPGETNAICIRNTGGMEYPLAAGIMADAPPMEIDFADEHIVQGGAVYTMPFSPAVESVQVVLMTNGRPLNARIELLQGPNNNKQVMEVYSEDGQERPFCVVMDTPGAGNVVRVVNTASVEYPLRAILEPYIIDSERVNTGGIQWSD